MACGFDDDVGGDVGGGEVEHVAHTVVSALRLSGTSGLASNPANRQIASSSGASAEHHKKKILDFFYFFFSKKT